MSPQQDSNNEDSAVEDEEEEYDEEDGRPQSKAKRQKLDPAERVLRRREKRLWQKKGDLIQLHAVSLISLFGKFLLTNYNLSVI